MTESAPQPLVFLYTGTDDTSRGDVHGASGVGRLLGKKIGGIYKQVGDADLAALYPEEKDKSAALAHYFADNGKPDVLLSKFWRIHDKALAGHKPLLVFEDNNEYLSQKYLHDKSLVTHHVTEEKLQEQGTSFRATYPSLPAPLIGVLVAQLSAVDELAEKIASKAAASPQATIFVTDTWRTRAGTVQSLMDKIDRNLKALGAENRVKVISHPYEKDAAYNPYLGLLDTADHIVLAGHSLSMMTETMAAGKAPLLYKPGNDELSLAKRGLVKDFHQAAAKTPFENSAITPFNPTETIAQKMADEFRTAAFRKKLNPAYWVKKLFRP